MRSEKDICLCDFPAEPYLSVVVALSLRSEDTSRVDLSSPKETSRVHLSSPKETSRDHLVFFSLSSFGQGVGARNGSPISRHFSDVYMFTNKCNVDIHECGERCYFA